MVKPCTLQLRAVLLTLLLAGCECSRAAVDFNMLEAGTVGQGAAINHSSAVHQLGSSSPVCGEKMDMNNPDAAVARYEEKCVKLTALSDGFREMKCTFGCIRPMLKIKAGLAEFESCSRALDDASMPSKLRSIMTSPESSTSLQATLTLVQTNVLMQLKKQHMFPPKGQCEFKPQGFDFEEARGGNMDAMFRRLFGNDCGSEDSVENYIQSLPKDQGKVVTAFIEKAKQLIQILSTQGADEAERSIEQEITKLENDATKLETDADNAESFLDLGPEQADEASLLIVGLIIVLVSLVLIIFMMAGSRSQR